MEAGKFSFKFSRQTQKNPVGSSKYAYFSSCIFLTYAPPTTKTQKPLKYLTLLYRHLGLVIHIIICTVCSFSISSQTSRPRYPFLQGRLMWDLDKNWIFSPNFVSIFINISPVNLFFHSLNLALRG
jgi:hypothetical protein